MSATSLSRPTVQRSTVRNAWHAHDLELLEKISADDYTRDLFLRLARHQRDGGLGYLLEELAADTDVDDETAAAITELVTDGGFLRAVEDYVDATSVRH